MVIATRGLDPRGSNLMLHSNRRREIASSVRIKTARPRNDKGA
jgi:hypothetical protein